MTDLNLTHLKQIAINAVEPASVEIAGLKEGTLTYGFDTDPFKASKFYETFDPPTVLALIDRIEQAEHRAKRYKALAETRLETIQQVRDLHVAGPGIPGDDGNWHYTCSTCRVNYPCPTIQTIEGDQK